MVVFLRPPKPDKSFVDYLFFIPKGCFYMKNFKLLAALLVLSVAQISVADEQPLTLDSIASGLIKMTQESFLKELPELSQLAEKEMKEADQLIGMVTVIKADRKKKAAKLCTDDHIELWAALRRNSEYKSFDDKTQKTISSYEFKTCQTAQNELVVAKEDLLKLRLQKIVSTFIIDRADTAPYYLGGKPMPTIWW